MQDKDEFLGLRMSAEMKEALKAMSPSGRMSEVALSFIEMGLAYAGPEQIRKQMAGKKLERLHKEKKELQTEIRHIQEKIMELQNEIREKELRIREIDAEEDAIYNIPAEVKQQIKDLGLRAVEEKSDEIADFSNFMHDLIYNNDRLEQKKPVDFVNIFEIRIKEWMQEHGVKIPQQKQIKIVAEVMERIKKEREAERKEKMKELEAQRKARELTDDEKVRLKLFITDLIDESKEPVVSADDFWDKYREDLHEWRLALGRTKYGETKVLDKRWILEQVEDILKG